MENIENTENPINTETYENPNTEAMPVEGPSQKCTCSTEPEEKKSCGCHQRVPLCVMCTNIVLLVGLVLLYIFHFTGVGTKSNFNPDAVQPVIPEDGVLKVACIDADTLLAKYQYAIDLQDELNRYKDAQMRSAQEQMAKFQRDYDDFIKNGEKMTLSQQQAKETELKQRYEKLSTLESEVTNRVMQKQIESNIELLNRIFAFVREYNAANQQFDIILRKAFVDSPTIYMNPAMDITDEIVKGLNEEYASVKKK